MSTKKSIEEQEKELRLREEKVKKQLDNDSDELKDRLLHVGKIAAISGAVALLGYWVYQSFFSEDEADKEEKPKSARKRPSHLPSALTTLAIPYLEKVLDGFFDKDSKESTSKEKK